MLRKPSLIACRAPGSGGSGLVALVNSGHLLGGDKQAIIFVKTTTVLTSGEIVQVILYCTRYDYNRASAWNFGAILSVKKRHLMRRVYVLLLLLLVLHKEGDNASHETNQEEHRNGAEGVESSLL